MDYTNLYRTLTYAGTLPFIACALMSLAGLSLVPGLGSPMDVAAAYGLAIVSFMAGTHWGMVLVGAHKAPINLFIASNVVTVTAWLAFLVAPMALTLATLIGAFAFLLFIDYRLKEKQILTALYLRTRLHATIIAIVSLAATLFAL